MKAHIWGGWHFNGAREHDIGMAEDRVDAEAPGFGAHHPCSDFVGSPSVDALAVGAHPARITCLVRGIVGDFRLIEISAPGIAIPQNLILLMMLDEEAVCGDAIAVDYDAVGARVQIPANAGAMVGAPDPGVIDDGVVRVDAQVDDCAAHACSADAEENVGELNRVAGVIRMAPGGADSRAVL